MNKTKNGIPRDYKPGANYGKGYRAIPNQHRQYATLYRREDFTPVWLIIPFNGKEINQLKKEGWGVIEVWERK